MNTDQENSITRGVHASEAVLVLSGVAFLASTVVFASGGGMTVWFIAKVLFGIGVLLFLVNR